MGFNDFAKKHGGTLMIVGTILAGSAVAFAIYRRNRNKIMIAKIEDVINKNLNVQEALGKAVNNAVFKGYKEYVNHLKTIGVSSYIYLKQFEVDKAVEDLYKAMKGGWTGAGTDEDKIMNVFNSLRDQVAVSQVFEDYKKKYKADLNDHLKGELSNYWMAEIYDSILRKPKYRMPK